MGLRRTPGANTERPDDATIHEGNMGMEGNVAILGVRLVQTLQEHRKATIVLDDGGVVRFIDPQYTSIRLPDEDEIIQTMTEDGASNEDILAALALRRSMKETP